MNGTVSFFRVAWTGTFLTRSIMVMHLKVLMGVSFDGHKKAHRSGWKGGCYGGAEGAQLEVVRLGAV
jgi:hypothetical protein